MPQIPPQRKPSIVIFADDLSGAAELAGAAWRHGLTAVVATEPIESCAADVCCLDTNTRLLNGDAAAARTAQFASSLTKLQPQWIFKKTDSLLRGNVAAEISTILNVTGQTRSLLCPANPTRGRLIRNGRYFVNDVPLDQTAFARDPLHPRLTSNVRELLATTSAHVQTPNVATSEDLIQHAQSCDPVTLPAGGVDFFEAMLVNRGVLPAAHNVPPLTGNRLFVCGSPAAWSAGRRQEAMAHGIATTSLGDSAIAASAARIVSHGHCQIVIGDVRGEPQSLGDSLASVVSEVLASCQVDLLLLEGGATATTVLARLGWKGLHVLAEIASGTVLLAPARQQRPWLVIKPGSYAWPPNVWP